MITYTWKVTGVKTLTQGNNANAVVQTYWKKIGTDDQGNTGEFTGATPFDASNVPADKFVPFDQLTEEVVIGWIKGVVTGTYEKHVNEQIAKSLAPKPVDAAMPWAPPVDPVAPPTPPAPV
jgi:hypothetical protein